MKYFAIFDKNVSTIFQLQWNIENIPDIFLQYSVLCGVWTLGCQPSLNILLTEPTWEPGQEGERVWKCW